jgi:uncharacterized protein involved in exopolysaccharide biosynthesis
MANRPDEDLDDLAELGPEATSRPGLPVDFGRIWLSFKRDWRWIPIAGGIWLALGLIIAFGIIKHTYKSDAIMVWEPRGNGLPDQRVLATQAASLKMPITLAKVKQRLKLPYPIQSLEKQIEVWFDMRTHLVTVQSMGPSAEEARMLTRSVIDVFLENQTEIARARAGDSAGALEKDLIAARTQQDLARKAYDAFRAEHGISDIESETRLAVEAAAELKAEQQRAQAEALALSARAERLDELFRKQKSTSVMSASVSNANADRANALAAELATAQARFSADHPTVARLKAELAAVQASANSKGSQTSNVVMGANPEYQSIQSSLSTTKADQEAASTRRESFAGFAEGADQRVARLSAIEGKARTLVAEIEVSNSRIEELEVQLATAKDAVRTPTIEFRVLTPAALPEYPERSKRRMIALGMPIGGVLVALLVLLLRPLKDGRIYTAREAAFWANMPVVSSSAWPRNKDAFFPLIDELGDDGGGARGFTLVLSASGRERVLAEELAYWLGGSSLGSDGKAEVQTAAAAQDAAQQSSGQAAQGQSVHVVAGGGQAGEAVAASGSTGSALAVIPSSKPPAGSSLTPYRRGAMTATRAGTHAWVGDNDGPALRRAARAADRVLVVLTSGTELFTSLAALRTRLGRDNGVALLLLGVSPELLNLPDRVGDVERFWRQTAARV